MVLTSASLCFHKWKSNSMAQRVKGPKQTDAWLHDTTLQIHLDYKRLNDLD